MEQEVLARRMLLSFYDVIACSRDFSSTSMFSVSVSRSLQVSAEVYPRFPSIQSPTTNRIVMIEEYRSSNHCTNTSEL